jgi:hypothetical protein
MLKTAPRIAESRRRLGGGGGKGGGRRAECSLNLALERAASRFHSDRSRSRRPIEVE